MQKLQKRARARAHAGRVVGDMHAKLLQDALVTVSAQQDEIDSRSMELQDKDANVKELRLKVELSLPKTRNFVFLTCHECKFA